jgi:uncharacterized membrane protein
LLNGFVLQAAFKGSGRERLEEVVRHVYRYVAFGMFVVWGFQYVPVGGQFAFFTASGMLLFGVAWLTKSGCRKRLAGILIALGFVVFWFFGSSSQVSGWNLAVLLAAFAFWELVRRHAGDSMRGKLGAVIPYLLTATLWQLTTRWLGVAYFRDYATVTWSLLAGVILAAGFVLRYGAYRRAGLALLALAVGRIVFVDVWQLGPVYRIVSFMVLGGVLVALGYVYNRFAERIRGWMAGE